MSKIPAFVQLDLLTLRPYYKSVFVLLATGSVSRGCFILRTISKATLYGNGSTAVPFVHASLLVLLGLGAGKD